MMNRTVAAATLVAVVALSPGALWVGGQYRHHRDIRLCTFGGVEAPPGPITWGTAPAPTPPPAALATPFGPSEPVLDPSCVAEREARRWGPFLVFGDLARED